MHARTLFTNQVFGYPALEYKDWQKVGFGGVMLKTFNDEEVLTTWTKILSTYVLKRFEQWAERPYIDLLPYVYSFLPRQV